MNLIAKKQKQTFDLFYFVLFAKLHRFLNVHTPTQTFHRLKVDSQILAGQFRGIEGVVNYFFRAHAYLHAKEMPTRILGPGFKIYT